MAGQDNSNGDDEDDKTVFNPVPPPAPEDGGDDDKTVFEPAPPPPPENEEEDEKTVFLPRLEPGEDAEAVPPAQAPSPAPPPNPSAFPDSRSSPPNPSGFPGAPASPSEPIRPIEVGDYVNVYRVEKFIARGGMGEVWQAVNPHPPHEQVAVKIMLPDLARDENVLNMFYKEASALGRLHHENIVQYRIASQGPNGQPYLITEFVDGPSLEELLGEFSPDEAQLKRLTQRLTRGLGAAHAQGVVHRDIAPDNILLVAGDAARPKIIDFGIVKDTSESNKTIIGDGTAGKLRYMAPEQMGEYNRNVGPWTDIYSLALTMLAVATGDHADMGGSMADAVLKRRGVPDLSAIPEALRPAFTAALQPNPADRPQTMAEFSGLLDDGSKAVTGALGGLDAPLNPEKDAAGKQDRAPHQKDGKKDKPGLFTDPSKKWIVYGGAGAVAALAILVTVIVFATSPDDLPEDAVEGGTGQVAQGTSDPAAPSIDQIAAAAVQEVDCAWLTFDGASGNSARFTGGAARPGAVQTALEGAFAANGMPNVTPDTRGLVTFGENLCPMVDALRTARSERPLMSTPQESYEIEMQESVHGDSAEIARPILQASGLSPDDEAILLYIDDTDAGVFSDNREMIRRGALASQGSVTTTGFQTKVEYETEGGAAFVIVTGQQEFPRDLFPRTDEAELGEIRVTPDWANRFEQAARENNWQTDILWFRITDDVPN